MTRLFKRSSLAKRTINSFLSLDFMFFILNSLQAGRRRRSFLTSFVYPFLKYTKTIVSAIESALKKLVYLLQINQQLELKRQRKSTCKQHIMTRKHGADVTCQHIAKHHSRALKCQKAVFLFLVSFLTTRWTSSKWQEQTKLDLICGKAVSDLPDTSRQENKVKWTECCVQENHNWLQC